jgi:hypothetical protein
MATRGSTTRFSPEIHAGKQIDFGVPLERAAGAILFVTTCRKGDFLLESKRLDFQQARSSCECDFRGANIPEDRMV